MEELGKPLMPDEQSVYKGADDPVRKRLRKVSTHDILVNSAL